MSPWRITGIVVGLTAAAAVVFVLSHKEPQKEEGTPSTPLADVLSSQAVTPPPSNPDTSQTPDTRPPDSSIKEGRYTNSTYGFSFEIPEGFKQQEFPDENGEVVVVAKSAKEGFQIYVLPFDESGPLTLKRIKHDQPNLLIRNAHKATLGGVEALAFESQNDSIGATFEVWTVANGYLFEVTTYTGFAGELGSILQTWTFRS